jgi:hypothetical protein
MSYTINVAPKDLLSCRHNVFWDRIYFDIVMLDSRGVSGIATCEPERPTF